MNYIPNFPVGFGEQGRVGDVQQDWEKKNLKSHFCPARLGLPADAPLLSLLPYSKLLSELSPLTLPISSSPPFHHQPLAT